MVIMRTFVILIAAAVSVKALSSPNRGPCKVSQTRADFIRKFVSGTLMVAAGGPSSAAKADDRSIAACKLQRGGSPANCVSTSSVKQVDCYISPWTYDISTSEAIARLKGVFAADPMVYEKLTEENGNCIRVQAVRGLVVDELEFLFDDAEKIVKFKSAELSGDEPPTISDFGANRRRLEGIRKAAKIFDPMGGGGFDSIETRGTGPLGQLKSFYGLQSGSGFEDVFEE